MESRKRSVNGAPTVLEVETLIVTDLTIYNKHKTLTNSTDPNVIYAQMRIYYAYLLNAVKRTMILYEAFI